jgi:hypothetical protein
MAAVIHRTTLQYLSSVNTPDYPEPTWKWNPDMSHVASVAFKYWKWDALAECPIPMTAGEQAAVDSSEAAAAAAALLDEQTRLCPALSKGDMAVHDGTKIRRLSVGNDEEFLLADSTQALGVKWSRARMTPVVKSAHQQRANTTTLANDNTLSFTVASSTSYVFRAALWFDTPAAADFKFAVSGPASPVAVRIQRQAIACGATAWSSIGVDTSFGVSVAVLGTGSTGGYVEINGVIDTNSTPGTVAIQWAQNTSNAGNTIVTKGSYIEWAKVS